MKVFFLTAALIFFTAPLLAATFLQIVRQRYGLAVVFGGLFLWMVILSCLVANVLLKE